MEYICELPSIMIITSSVGQQSTEDNRNESNSDRNVLLQGFDHSKKKPEQKLKESSLLFSWNTEQRACGLVIGWVAHYKLLSREGFVNEIVLRGITTCVKWGSL